MKKSLLAILLIAILPTIASADYKLKLSHEMYTEEHLDPGFGVELQVGPDKLPWYWFASYNNADFKWGAQPWAMVDIFGTGLGIRRMIFMNVHLFGQVGYYHPTVGLAAAAREAANNYVVDQYTYVSKLYGPYYKFNWPTDSLKIQGNFGGKIGLEAEWKIYKDFNLGVDIGYRILSLRHVFERSDPQELAKDPNSQLCWGQNISYNGFSIGIFGTF